MASSLLYPHKEVTLVMFLWATIRKFLFVDWYTHEFGEIFISIVNQQLIDTISYKAIDCHLTTKYTAIKSNYFNVVCYNKGKYFV